MLYSHTYWDTYKVQGQAAKMQIQYYILKQSKGNQLQDKQMS